MRFRSARAAAVAALSLSVVVAAVAPAGASAVTIPKITGGKFSDCFWTVGVVNGGTINIAYPDAGANYWGAIYTLPAGATLRLKGSFPHARYVSVQSYNAFGTVQDALADFQINPDRGSSNPFRPGANRLAAKRAFTLTLDNASPPAAADPAPRSNAPARNRLATTPTGDATGVKYVVWRTYIPDRGRDLRGGVALPTPELTLADGTVLKGQELCNALSSQEPRLPDVSSLLIPPADYAKLADKTGKPAYFPAQDPAVWRVQYNRAYLLALWNGQVIPHPPKGGTGGFFPNLHNQYVRAALHRKLGKVVALRGTMATTPSTFKGDKIMRSTQLRYQSFCMNESVVTTRVMDCAYDEEIPLAKGRKYVVVTSRKADRPKNAIAKCGVAWVEWSPRGDGAADHDFGWMQIRNMLPAPGFHHAVQDTKAPGDEKRVLGAYLPSVKYYSGKTQFEKLGCPAR